MFQASCAAQVPAQESVFATFDRDGNAALDFEEFVAMQPRRVRDTHSLKEMQEWFDAADEDGNGSLSINEFLRWSLGKAKSNNAIAILEHAFRKFDKSDDGNASIDFNQFKVCLENFGLMGLPEKDMRKVRVVAAAMPLLPRV